MWVPYGMSHSSGDIHNLLYFLKCLQLDLWFHVPFFSVFWDGDYLCSPSLTSQMWGHLASWVLLPPSLWWFSSLYAHTHYLSCLCPVFYIAILIKKNKTKYSSWFWVTLWLFYISISYTLDSGFISLLVLF